MLRTDIERVGVGASLVDAQAIWRAQSVRSEKGNPKGCPYSA